MSLNRRFSIQKNYDDSMNDKMQYQVLDCDKAVFSCEPVADKFPGRDVEERVRRKYWADQDRNSKEQQEACEAYLRYNGFEGWKNVHAYWN